MPLALITSRSPQRPSDVVIEAPGTTPEEVAQHAAAARAAGQLWRGAPAADRATALAAAADALGLAGDELTALVVREVGKPLTEAASEVARAVAILRYFAQQVFDPVGSVHAPSAAGLLFSQRRPHGLAGLITPWNFPLAIPLWKAAPALAFGNAVLLKPAPAATATAVRLGELLATVFPPDLFRVVPGEAATGMAVTEMADCVSFTGSAAVGRMVAQSAVEHGVAVQTEMGGQNAAVVFDDADPETAARHIAAAAYGYAGQKCTATRRVILVGAAAERGFVEALAAATSALPVGDPAAADTVVGPVIGEPARQAVVDAAAEAVRDGGRVVAGGSARDDDGWFVAPTLIDGLEPGHRLCQEEVFGPICTILRVRDVPEAIRLVNSVRYGLVTGVYGRDLDRALAVVDGVDTGLVKVNAPTSGVDFYLPFGGTKDSSYGPREQGKAARDFYTYERTVAIAPSA